ncbi:MAG: FAD-dependent oxidoreductase [Leptospira sp.]|nr:FAD-dependent oxidoreductase [Leptospira sp.]
MKPPIIVIGGGISGLVTAYHAQKKGQKVILFEKTDHLGGFISTKHTAYGLVETAANGLLLNENIESLFKELNLKFIFPQAQAKRRYFYKLGKIFQFPFNFFSFIRAIFGFFFIDAYPKDEENLCNYFNRILGSDLTSSVIEPAIGGIYAAKLDQLDPRMVFSQINWKKNRSLFKHILSRKKGNKTLGLISFQHGMGELVSALKNNLGPNVSIHLNTDAPSLATLQTKYKNPIIQICLSLKSCESYIRENFPSALDFNKNINLSYLTISSITNFYQNRLTNKSGFGILFPQDQGILAYGVIFNSDIFKDRTVNETHHSETWIYAGNFLDELSETEILEFQMKDRKLINQNQETPIGSYITNWKNSFPIYDKNLWEWNLFLDRLENSSELNGYQLKFKGNYRRGIGLRNLIEMASS